MKGSSRNEKREGRLPSVLKAGAFALILVLVSAAFIVSAPGGTSGHDEQATGSPDPVYTILANGVDYDVDANGAFLGTATITGAYPDEISAIKNAVEMIKAHAAGNDCEIFLGNGIDYLDLGTKFIAIDGTEYEEWGHVTIRGRAMTAGTYPVILATDVTLTTGADLLNTNPTAGFAVGVDPTATVNVIGGMLEVTGVGMTIVNSGGILNITGGTIYNPGPSVPLQISMLGEVHMSGGTIRCTSNQTAVNFHSGFFEVTGGTIECTGTYPAVTMLTGSLLRIGDATLSTAGTYAVRAYSEAGYVELCGTPEINGLIRLYPGTLSVDTEDRPFVPGSNNYTVEMDEPFKGAQVVVGGKDHLSSFTTVNTGFELIAGTADEYGNLIFARDFTISPGADTGGGKMFVTVGNDAEKEFLSTETLTERTDVAFRAESSAGHVFTGWDGLGTNDNPYAFVLDGDYTVAAVFTPLYDVTISMDGPGTLEYLAGGQWTAVDVHGTYVLSGILKGTELKVRAMPEDGYSAEWNFSYGTARGALFECIVNGDLTVALVFVVTPAADGSGLLWWIAAILAIVLFITLLPAFLTRHRIHGLVTCNGIGLKRVTIEHTVNGMPGKVTTDHDGNYAITAPAGAEVAITAAKKDGYTSGELPGPMTAEKDTVAAEIVMTEDR